MFGIRDLDQEHGDNDDHNHELGDGAHHHYLCIRKKQKQLVIRNVQMNVLKSTNNTLTLFVQLNLLAFYGKK